MTTSKLLIQSKEKKNDEFYTLYQDIADEVSCYKEQLRGKRILCPCDWDESYNEELVYKEEGVAAMDLFSYGTVKHINLPASKERIEKDFNAIKFNFVKFLVAHAEAYGILSVSVSGYDPATSRGVRFQDIDYSQYDIIITNPPFSQYREFIDTMMRHKKLFLAIGPQNAITYKECFDYIMNNRMWMGYHQHLTGFVLPDGTVLQKNDSLPRCCCWFTNLDVSYRHDRLILTESYTPETYPTYHNYDAIEVTATKKIPFDYEGKMGVPITFLQKYNPDQFEILGESNYLALPFNVGGKRVSGRFYLESAGTYKRMYSRIVIRNKQVIKQEE